MSVFHLASPCLLPCDEDSEISFQCPHTSPDEGCGAGLRALCCLRAARAGTHSTPSLDLDQFLLLSSSQIVLQDCGHFLASPRHVFLPCICAFVGQFQKAEPYFCIFNWTFQVTLAHRVLDNSQELLAVGLIAVQPPGEELCFSQSALKNNN